MRRGAPRRMKIWLFSREAVAGSVRQRFPLYAGVGGRGTGGRA
ncbi:hypothetical protein [Candidatus Hakubella thermalkaliphila]|nr:hypothetical protein [Candidatus Hakubella thermalkaliphila]